MDDNGLEFARNTTGMTESDHVVREAFERLEMAWPGSVLKGGLRSFASYLRQQADTCDRMAGQVEARIASGALKVVK